MMSNISKLLLASVVEPSSNTPSPVLVTAAGLIDCKPISVIFLTELSALGSIHNL